MDAVGAAYASNEGREPLFDFDRLGIAHDEIVAVWSEVCVREKALTGTGM
jgi:hypothetical protein